MFMGQRRPCRMRVGRTNRSDCTSALIPPLMRFVTPAWRAPWGWIALQSHGSVRSAQDRQDWTPRGTEGFLGQLRLPGAKQSNAQALILMGDWYAAT